jgi:hypothetical protein
MSFSCPQNINDLSYGSSIDDLINAFKKLKPQLIINSDDPRRLRLGFYAQDDDLLITVSVRDFKDWSDPDAVKAVQTIEGRKAFIDVIRSRAWGLTTIEEKKYTLDEILTMMYDASHGKTTELPMKDLLVKYKDETGKDHPGFM